MRAYEFITERKVSASLCQSGRRLGRSDYSQCVSKGLKAHTSKGKGHTDGHGNYIKGKKYGGPLPDYE